MRRRSLHWQLYFSFLGVALAALFAVTWYAARSLRHFYYERTAADLATRLRLVLFMADARLLSDSAAAGRLLHELSGRAGARLTFIAPGGKVLADSAQDPAQMENHSNRPEVAAALAGHEGRDVHFSRTLLEPQVYVALPVRADNRVMGALRASVSLAAVASEMRGVQARILLGGVVMALIVSGVSLLVARRIARPIAEIQRGAEHFARGELDFRLPACDSKEIGALADVMNRMAAQLRERLEDLAGQRNELEAILSGMVEGVIAVSPDENLLRMNAAAAHMLDIPPTALGRKISEVVRNTELQHFIRRLLNGTTPIEGELSVNGVSERVLQAHGSLLQGEGATTIGALLVLHDITRLKRLESVRRDFVANVSHELKTPVTSIKGFVETLQDGALNQPADAERFLGIIARQADRLNTIIDDLLSLSRIEQESDAGQLDRKPAHVREILSGAALTCQVKADARRVTLRLNCAPELQARVNARLVEQAVVNLLDNAIKFSEPGQPVEVDARLMENSLVIVVRDRGCGIPREHLPRLFERFYRVDKARSRELGGTGLGLAIVKHIAQAHGGQVTVESVPGQGSTFRLYFPNAA